MTHYDVIIFGESLASRIAGVLLARAGRRVLALAPPPEDPPSASWIPFSLHLERLLDLLDGRSCLVAAAPFQVLSGQVRLTLHGISTLTDELRREFPADSARVESLLRGLKDTGNRLEAALWESGGLPLTGWTSRWRFMCSRLRKGLAAGRLARPLANRLQAVGTARTAQAITALFGGLSLTPVERLSVAEGALLWRSFGDGRGVSGGALHALLTHRFEQFRGEHGHLGDLQQLQSVDRRLHQVAFRNGRRCSAEVFLLGSPDAGALVPAECLTDEVAARSTASCEVRALDGRISPLLTQVVILDGTPPLRLTMAPDPARRQCRILCQTASPASAPAFAGLEERLSTLLPFADLRFEPRAGTPDLAAQHSGRTPRQKLFPGATNSLVAGERLLHCCGEQVLPTLGATGEIMVGVSVGNHLQRQKQR